MVQKLKAAPAKTVVTKNVSTAQKEVGSKQVVSSVSKTSATPSVVAATKPVTTSRFSVNYTGDKDFKAETIQVPCFDGTPVAFVTCELGVTLAAGEGNFAKVKRSVCVPCYPVDSEIDRAMEYAKSTVDAYLEKDIIEIQSDSEESEDNVEEGDEGDNSSSNIEDSGEEGSDGEEFTDDDDEGSVTIEVGTEIVWQEKGKEVHGIIKSIDEEESTVIAKAGKREVSLSFENFDVA